MSELVDLEIGDVIKLENKISEEAIIKLENKVVYHGRPGVVNNKKAVKITRKII